MMPAVAQGADHLILDEPTNHLDVQLPGRGASSSISGLGVTVLAAIHDLALAALFCDDVTLLGRGRLFATARPAVEVIHADAIVGLRRRGRRSSHPDTGHRSAGPPSQPR